MKLSEIFESSIQKLNESGNIDNIMNVGKNWIYNYIKFTGARAFDNDNEAIEYLINRVDFLKKLSKSNPLILYRLISLKNSKINKKALGSHWVSDDSHFNYEDWKISIGKGIYRNEGEYYKITVSVNPNTDIDWNSTLIFNLTFPQEEEITLKNRGADAKLISVEKLEQ